MGCNARFPKSALLRVVRDPDGNVSLDFTGKKSGRGAYICKEEKCLLAAAKAKRFERAFSTALPEEVVAAIAEELR